MKEWTRAGTYSLQSSICFSIQGCSLSPARLQGRIWFHLLLPLFSSAAWREGQGEEKTGMCRIATPSLDILYNFLCLAQVGRQSSSLIKHSQIILLATEQSHDSFALSLPTTWAGLFLPILFFFNFVLSHTSILFFYKASLPFKWKAFSEHLTNRRIHPITPAMPRMHVLFVKILWLAWMRSNVNNFICL